MVVLDRVWKVWGIANRIQGRRRDLPTGITGKGFNFGTTLVLCGIVERSKTTGSTIRTAVVGLMDYMPPLDNVPENTNRLT